MNVKDALELLATVPLPPVPTRFQRQQQLESLLVQFSPDANETKELLAALMMGMENRIDRDKWADVDHEYAQLSEALEELDKTLCEVGDEDFAFDNWRATQE
jgi:hypothetical protein